MTGYAVLPRPEVGRAGDWRFPAVTQLTLGNGVRVLQCHVPGKPLVAVSVLADAPLDAEPRGREGVATIAARTLTEGTELRDAEAFAEALERQGASLHTDAGYGGLAAVLQVPGSRLSTGLALLAEAVISPAFAESEVDRAVAERLDEITQDLASPGRRAEIELAAALYAPGSRPAQPRGGAEQTVAGLSRADVASFYAGYADPRSATVVIAGDLREHDVEALLEATLGGWPSVDVTTHSAQAAERQPGRRLVVVDRPDAVQTQLALGRPTVTRQSPDYPALEVATYILGGTLTSRIDSLLREEKGYTYGIRAVQRPERTHGTFVVYGSVDTPSTVPAVADLLGVVETADRDGLTDDEREKAADYLAGVAPLRWETPRAIAGHLTALAGAGIGPGWTDHYLDGIRGATIEELDAALRGHVVLDDLTIVAVGSAESIVPALSPLGDVTVVS